MTPEAQRIALAEACPTIAGERHGKEIKWFWKDSLGTWRPCHRNDPLNDLNAMHEVEKLLRGTVEQYHNEREYHDRWCRYQSYLLHYAGVSATAAQRAEAFLRTLNLWQSTPCTREDRCWR